jgi:hypothetical protein
MRRAKRIFWFVSQILHNSLRSSICGLIHHFQIGIPEQFSHFHLLRIVLEHCSFWIHQIRNRFEVLVTTQILSSLVMFGCFARRVFPVVIPNHPFHLRWIQNWLWANWMLIHHLLSNQSQCSPCFSFSPSLWPIPIRRDHASLSYPYLASVIWVNQLEDNLNRPRIDNKDWIRTRISVRWSHAACDALSVRLFSDASGSKVVWLTGADQLFPTILLPWAEIECVSSRTMPQHCLTIRHIIRQRPSRNS